VKIRKAGVAAGWLLAVLLVGCAASVETVPVVFQPAAGGDIAIASDVAIQLATGYRRSLPAGSRWRKVGSVPQGDVYRPVDTVFTIEGRHVHEAYLVLTPQRALTAFYLPGESNLSTLAAPIPLPLKEAP
jgi:hypothetical protein